MTGQFHIGIDLGTTHTVVAFAAIDNGTAARPQLFEIDQLVAAGEIAKRPQLPSFRYHPAIGELAGEDVQLPWQQTLNDEIPQVIIGEWARLLGSKTDSRSVFSAKSWLSHPQVNRTAAILPWGADATEVDKVSPLHASASYLHYIRCAWNFEHPQALLEHQEVVITIPASFDEMARSLTVAAAHLAGITKLCLLEEPQAACYDWYALAQQQQPQNDQTYSELSTLSDKRLMLIVDVGGGTTDLSLVQLSKNGANNSALPQLKRIGVGDHLMLGGDNIDLALAHISEQQISARFNKKLSTAQLSQLTQQTRIAKETLLSDAAPEAAKVTLLGAGARLIGGATSANLTREQVQGLALDGFMPLTPAAELPNKRRAAVVELGLPYAAEPAISKHIAEFLQRHQQACAAALGTDLEQGELALPDVVLLNGGFFNSSLLAQRCIALINSWRHARSLAAATQLENTRPNDAVAYGAVAYAQAKRGQGMVISGGSARSFFLEVPGHNDQALAICLLPKGTDTDIEVLLEQRRFTLNVGQPVSFNLLASNFEQNYLAGDIASAADQSQLQLLPPLVAALDHKFERAASAAPDNTLAQERHYQVQLIASLSEVGTLRLECINADNIQQRWQLEFQIRKPGQQRSPDPAVSKHWPAALALLDCVYGDSNNSNNSDKQAGTHDHKQRAKADPVKNLRADLEQCLGARDSWSSATLRALFDQLLASEKRRRRSNRHERSWFSLAGFTLRPGFGYPADEWRIQQLWPIIEEGLQFEDHQNWASWWTFLRHVGGGFSAEQQLMIYGVFKHFIDPANLKKRQLMAELKPLSYDDMVRLAASFEHLPATEKSQLGHWLLQRLQTNKTETQASWWALGRIGSRNPFYGHIENLVPVATVSEWLTAVLKQNWKKKPDAALAGVLLAQRTDDRGRDIDEALRAKVIQQLQASKAPALWLRMVAEVTALSEEESKMVLGDSLPSGLTLLE